MLRKQITGFFLYDFYVGLLASDENNGEAAVVKTILQV